jgi:hypothetical protein
MNFDTAESRLFNCRKNTAVRAMPPTRATTAAPAPYCGAPSYTRTRTAQKLQP